MNKWFGLLASFIVLCSTQFYFLGDYNLKSSLLSNIIVFLSIIFGFYITSLAIFVTSEYVAGLYKIIDKKKSKVTLLHILINNYKLGLNLILFSILYLLIIQFVLNQCEEECLKLSNPFLVFFLWTICANFWYSHKMLLDIMKIILQEAKSKSRQ